MEQDATFPPFAPPPASSISLGLLFLLLMWPVIVLGVGGLWLNTRWQELAEEQALRPRIAVIDVEAVVAAERKGDTGEASFNRGLEQANATVKRLRDAGFLVIDSASVRAAPDAIQVPTR